MSPRQARRERREAERKAKKLELKKARQAGNHPLAGAEAFSAIQPRWNPELEHEFPREEQIRNKAMSDPISLQPGLPVPQSGFVSQKRAEANRANAQLSSGPKTPTGKLASSRNSTKHGLASGKLIIAGEDPAEFNSLLIALLNEHQPSGETEELLIQEMAQSHWLAQRAIRLQNTCFTEEGVNEKSLSLFLRYFTTHNRAFHKALADLQRAAKKPSKNRRWLRFAKRH